MSPKIRKSRSMAALSGETLTRFQGFPSWFATSANATILRQFWISGLALFRWLGRPPNNVHGGMSDEGMVNHRPGIHRRDHRDNPSLTASDAVTWFRAERRSGAGAGHLWASPPNGAEGLPPQLLRLRLLRCSRLLRLLRLRLLRCSRLLRLLRCSHLLQCSRLLLRRRPAGRRRRRPTLPAVVVCRVLSTQPIRFAQ